MSKILAALDTCLLLGKKSEKIYFSLYSTLPGFGSFFWGSVPVAAPALALAPAPAPVLEWWEWFGGCTPCPHNHTAPHGCMSNQWCFHQGSSGSPVFCWS